MAMMLTSPPLTDPSLYPAIFLFTAATVQQAQWFIECLVSMDWVQM